jgi:hypothetical protein
MLKFSFQFNISELAVKFFDIKFDLCFEGKWRMQKSYIFKILNASINKNFFSVNTSIIRIQRKFFIDCIERPVRNRDGIFFPKPVKRTFQLRSENLDRSFF